MRKLYSTFLAVLLTATLFSQSPQKMSYQAVIRNSSDQLVKSSPIGMRISILKDATPVYVETQTPTSNANGLVSIEVGTGTFVAGTFAGIDWSNGTYFIKTETDTAGGTTYSITGTSQLLSVPYALYAKTAGTSDALQNQINMLKFSSAAGGVVTDIDNNVYNTVKIGTQVWMAENLKTTKYNDGTPIPNITVDATWAALTTGAYGDYNNTPSNSTTYGRLYNWYAVDNNAGTKVVSNGGKNVCPTGWHVPSDAEWTTLENYLILNGYNWDGTTTGDKIAKSMASTSGWTASETLGTVSTSGWTVYGTLGTVGNDQASNNKSGFTAFPSGYRNLDGTSITIGQYGYWWSSTEYSTTMAYAQGLSYKLSNVDRSLSYKLYGISVRCLRD
ncbi:MAG: fibrobacter succinogenes major paralogous domain-containing protein [Bacteroidales bacterium]|jgi:uncharacterized protein (TIGR02145 family)